MLVGVGPGWCDACVTWSCTVSAESSTGVPAGVLSISVVSAMPVATEPASGAPTPAAESPPAMFTSIVSNWPAAPEDTNSESSTNSGIPPKASLSSSGAGSVGDSGRICAGEGGACCVLPLLARAQAV